MVGRLICHCIFSGLTCNCDVVLIFPTLLFSVFTIKKAHMFFVSFTNSFPKTVFVGFPIFLQRPGHAPTSCLYQQHHGLLPLVAIGTGTDSCIKNDLIHQAVFLWCTQNWQGLLPCSAWKLVVKSFQTKKLWMIFVCVLLILKLVGSRDFDVRGAKEDTEQGEFEQLSNLNEATLEWWSENDHDIK